MLGVIILIYVLISIAAFIWVFFDTPLDTPVAMYKDLYHKLREKYNGSLGQLVEKNESDYDEIANNVRKSFDEFDTLVKEYLGDKFKSVTNDPNNKTR